MNNPEERLSAYIDALNEERNPEKHLGSDDNPELGKLQSAARLVRSLKEPALPGPRYPERLAKAVAGAIQTYDAAGTGRQVGPDREQENRANKGAAGQPRRRWYLPSAAALAAGIILCAALAGWSVFTGRDAVYAMDKAVSKLSGYHGVLEMRARNAAGEEWMVRRVEIWNEGDKYATRQEDGTLTVNNGEQKWQVLTQSREVVLLPPAPDPTRNNFDLRNEARRAKQYPHTAAGTDTIAGRQAEKLEISPPGGLPYYLWIDAETNLPVQLQSAMQNALQTTYTFINFEPNAEIDPAIFTYQAPEGYKVVEKDPAQLVVTVAEAAAISGLAPLLPREAPDRIFAGQGRIVLDYSDTTVVETAAAGSFEPEPGAALGTAAGGQLEVWQERLRWRQDGLEILVEGARRTELAGQIAAGLALPDGSGGLVEKALVKVPVDMEIARADQRQVDGGHSPWQLDPLQVSLTFVNLKVTPEGINGEPVIPMSSFRLSSNNGVEAVVEVSSGPVKQVYLERLVRQDETGIWSVTGYDPR